MKKVTPKLTDELRRIVAGCDKTLGQISRETGIDKTALSRFVNGERGVSCAVMDKLGEYLRVRIVADNPPAKKGRLGSWQVFHAIQGGTRRIQFVGADRQRRAIRLGKVSQRTAEEIRTRVELLNTAKIMGQPIDGDTAHWVATRESKLLDKLAAVGLVPKRQSARLEAFIDGYVDSRVGREAGYQGSLATGEKRG